jgi:fumarate reductase subunit C
MPATWWLKKRSYFLFILREFSAVFVAIAAVTTILQVRALSNGPAAYAGFQDLLASPLVIVLALVTLAFALLHTITFFLLAGRILVIPVGEKPVPARAVVLGHFAGWAVVSLIFVLLVL